MRWWSWLLVGIACAAVAVLIGAVIHGHQRQTNCGSLYTLQAPGQQDVIIGACAGVLNPNNPPQLSVSPGQTFRIIGVEGVQAPESYNAAVVRRVQVYGSGGRDGLYQAVRAGRATLMTGGRYCPDMPGASTLPGHPGLPPLCAVVVVTVP